MEMPRPGPGPSPGPADQSLSTIDSGALLTAASAEEDGEGQRKTTMKSSSRVLLERHRRKRITQSCNTLQQLLPSIQGRRVDMVAVLETTVAFLEKVQELVIDEDQKLQSQETRELGQKMVTEQETLDRRDDELQKKKKKKKRRAD